MKQLTVQKFRHDAEFDDHTLKKLVTKMEWLLWLENESSKW